MNRPVFLLLCVLCGVSGYLGMAWHQRGTAAVPSPSAAAAATTAPAAKTRPTSIAGLSAVLETAGQLATSDSGSRNRLAALPPGAARELALALFDARARKAAGGGKNAGFNPFADVPADTPLAEPGMEGVMKHLLAGELLVEFDPAVEQDPFSSSGPSLNEIKQWAALDPAAASETILKMPAGKSRTAAVDAAAGVMARDNPQAAWDLVVKSGEQKLGEGAARAWLECAISPAGTGEQTLAKLPAPLREAILRETAALLNPAEPGSNTRVFTADELTGLAKGLRHVPFGPGKEALLTAMMSQAAFKPEMGTRTLTVTTDPETGSERSPEMEMLTGQEFSKLATEKPEEALQDIGQLLSAPNPTGEAALLKNAISYHAPEAFAALARAGHVKEVGPLVEHIRDPQQRRAALESILPQWMDADPAAARAAFHAAPFTALERERWQRHPSFLLNP